MPAAAIDVVSATSEQQPLKKASPWQKLSIDINAPSHSTPQPSSHTTEGEHLPEQQPKLPGTRVAAPSHTIDVPTPARRALRKETKQEVIFNFMTGEHVEVDQTANSEQQWQQPEVQQPQQQQQQQQQQQPLQQDLAAPAVGDTPLIGGRLGYLGGLLHASLGPRGNVPGTPLEKQRAQTDEDPSSERSASRQRLLTAAHVANPELGDSNDAKAEQRRKDTQIWRGQRSATDEYASLERFRTMHESEMCFLWRRCINCQFMYLCTEQTARRTRLERSVSLDSHRSSPRTIHSSVTADAFIPTMTSSSEPSRQPLASMLVHPTQRSPEADGGVDNSSQVHIGSGDSASDENGIPPEFSKLKYCSKECYWSLVFQNEI